MNSAASSPGHAAAHPHSRQHGHARPTYLAELLDLDAVVHAPLLDEALSIVAALTALPPGRILDVGAGSGTGTVALAQRFPKAVVEAIDLDESMLERVRRRADAEGVGARVATRLADVGAPGLALDTVDLTWSSAALHEVAEPARALRTLFETVRPGGHLVVVEMDAPPRLLDGDLAFFEHRLHAAAGVFHAAAHPDWSAAIAAAGFEFLLRRSLTVDRVMPSDGPAGEFARLELGRVAAPAMPRLGHDDRATLGALLGDGAHRIHRLGDIRVRSSRTLWAARRP